VKTNKELKGVNSMLENEASLTFEELVNSIQQLQNAVNGLGERVVKLENKNEETGTNAAASKDGKSDLPATDNNGGKV